MKQTFLLHSKRSFVCVAALLALTSIVYFPAMRAGFIWDDDDYVTNNQTLRSIDGLKRIWLEPGATPQYYPLVHTTYWIEYRLWKLSATGYHIVNIALHALNAALIWLALKRLALPGAWMAAAIFAVHPVHVESVAWITERKNVLSTAFYLAALLAYMRFALIHVYRHEHDASSRQWRQYFLSLMWFLLALLSKTVTCTFPAAVLLIIWWKHGRLRRSDILPAIPMFVIGALFGLITAWMEKTRVGAAGPEWQQSILQRCLIASRNVWFYFEKLIWPVDLAFIYPRWNINVHDWQPYVFLIAAIAVPTVLWICRHRIGRGPLAATLYFGGTLLPALGFIDVYPFRFSFVADHFQYLASISVITLAACGVTYSLVESKRFSPKFPVAIVLSLLPLLILGTLTWRQTLNYRDARTLWQDTLTKNPQAFIAHYNLGNIHQAQGEPKQALFHFQRALEIKPNLTPALNNIGVEYARAGQTEHALEYFHRAINSNPNYILALQGDTNAVIDQYLLDALHGAGTASGRLRRLEEAVEYLSAAVRLAPDTATSVEPRIDLAIALALQEKTDEALVQLNHVLALDPRNHRAQSLIDQFKHKRTSTMPDR